MGFSLKKAVKSVAKVVTSPVVAAVAIPTKIASRAGITNALKNTVGVDLDNISKVVQQTGRLEGSTGSDEFKNAAFDSAKIGLAVAGGTGAIAGTTAAGGFLLASKAQAGGGVSLGDVATIAGVPTEFGGIDLGNVNVVKPKQVQPLSSSIPEFFEDTYDNAVQRIQTITAPENKIYLYGGIGALVLVGFILIRKIKK